MSDPHQIARQILRLPSHERRIATAAFVQLVERRRQVRPPKRRSAVELCQAVGMEPDPWQRQLLESISPRILLNCSRQSGKSTLTALLAVHAALYDPGALVLLLSPSQRQSQELFRKALDMYRALDRPVSPRAESALCVFRRIAATDSDRSRPPIPIEAGHRFRPKPAILPAVTTAVPPTGSPRGSGSTG